MSQYTLTSYVVSPAELHSALQKNVYSRLSTAPSLVPLCASWFLPNDGRTGRETFEHMRIPHARFLDLDAVKDPHSPYPHMLPAPRDFAAAMSALGIHRDDGVVVYDSRELGLFSAPRVAWMLRVFGHPAVHVLNNFRAWCDAGLPTETGPPPPTARVDYPVPPMDRAMVASFDEVRNVAREQGKEGAEEVQILDARSEGRWRGTEPEPRRGTLCCGAPGS